MNDVFCLYYDDEIEQDMPLEPANIVEAIKVFQTFEWQNKHPQSAMKLLIYKTTDTADPSLYISCVQEQKWCLDIGFYQRRRFLGPFFRKYIHHTFIDLNQQQSEEIIQAFCTLPTAKLHEALPALLAKNQTSVTDN